MIGFVFSECIDLVQYGKPPSNKKERFKVLQTMFAHAQYAHTAQLGHNSQSACPRPLHR